jgi:hypothetical protein
MRHPDAQRALAILAGAPGIHLAVSVDHVNAGNALNRALKALIEP